MFIFGWNHQTRKNFGPTFKYKCSHCHNEEYWYLTRIITWFTLFFIPVIPYSVKYFLSCSICSYGLVLDQKQLDEMKPLAEINQELIDGKINQDEYQTKMALLSNKAPEQIEVNTNNQKLLKTSKNQEKISFCGKCGNKLTKSSKFCPSCGAKINLSI